MSTKRIGDLIKLPATKQDAIQAVLTSEKREELLATAKAYGLVVAEAQSPVRVLTLHEYINLWTVFVLDLGLEIGRDVMESYATTALLPRVDPQTTVGAKTNITNVLGRNTRRIPAERSAIIDARLSEVLEARLKQAHESVFTVIKRVWNDDYWTEEARIRAIEFALRDTDWTATPTAPFLMPKHVGRVTRTNDLSSATARLGSMFYEPVECSTTMSVLPPPFIDKRVLDHHGMLQLANVEVPYAPKFSVYENAVLSIMVSDFIGTYARTGGDS